MKLLIAGTMQQAEQYFRDGTNGLRRNEVKVASSPEAVRGCRFYEGDVIYYGTWWERKDLGEINRCIEKDPTP